MSKARTEKWPAGLPKKRVVHENGDVDESFLKPPSTSDPAQGGTSGISIPIATNAQEKSDASQRRSSSRMVPKRAALAYWAAAGCSANPIFIAGSRFAKTATVCVTENTGGIQNSLRSVTAMR